jgi:acyl carrier protein
LNDVINHFAPTERTLSSASVNSTPYLEEDENDLGNKTEVRPVDSEPVVMATVRTTSAEDVGIPLEGLTATKDLLDLGVDSLMSLVIIWELNQLDIEFPQPSLLENRTLQDIEKMLFPNDMLPQPKRYIYR